LKILASPDSKSDGIKIELNEGENLLGRAKPPAQIVLSGIKVSKKHCVFNVKGANLKVDDLRSSNGIFVNGARVVTSALKEKDRLVIGEFILEVGIIGASGPPLRKPGAKP
jgi:pSer/pThr/pTyr-binding forkhead associated (FHA) protein